MSTAVRTVAASLPAAERAGDHAQVARLLGTITTTRELTELVRLLARCADWRRVSAETGYLAAPTPRDLHAYFVSLRKAGVPIGDIGERIREGERLYQAQAKAAQRRRRQPDAT